MLSSLSCPANGSRECAPDDRLRRGIQHARGLILWLAPSTPLAPSPYRCYIGAREAASRVRSQHIPGALSIL